MATKPGIFRPTHMGTREAAAARYEQTRRTTNEWRAWYGTQRWRRIRARQLRDNPLCLFCDQDGKVTAATVCDHVVRHRGDPDLFWNGPFQSLCAPCHNSIKQAAERQRLG